MAEFQLDVTVDFACQAFRAKAPEVMAKNSLTTYDPSESLFRLTFLGQEYLVKYPEGYVSYPGRGEEVPLIIQVFILHYLSGPDGTPLQNKWISFKELPDGEIYYEVFKRSTINPLISIFGANPAKLVAASKAFNGQELSLGDYSIQINPFPLVPIALVLWEGDDEFPPAGNILFDASASNYLTTKDYSMMCIMLIPQLKSIAETL